MHKYTLIHAILHDTFYIHTNVLLPAHVSTARYLVYVHILTVLTILARLCIHIQIGNSTAGAGNGTEYSSLLILGLIAGAVSFGGAVRFYILCIAYILIIVLIMMLMICIYYSYTPLNQYYIEFVINYVFTITSLSIYIYIYIYVYIYSTRLYRSYITSPLVNQNTSHNNSS